MTAYGIDPIDYPTLSGIVVAIDKISGTVEMIVASPTHITAISTSSRYIPARSS